MTRQTRQSLRTLLAVLAVILAARLCYRLAHGVAQGPAEAAANFTRVLLYAGLFAMWGVSVSRRVIQSPVRRYLLAAVWLMISWLIVREYRWHLIPDADVRRWLWYAYYIPILLIPLLALFVSMSLDRPERYRLPRWTRLAYLPALLLAGLVLTNDLHRLVFVFPAGAPWTEAYYRYGPGFYVIAGWTALCTAAAFVIMLLRSRLPRGRGAAWLPVLPLLLALLYALGYGLRLPGVVGVLGDLAVCDCLIFTAFFESCIQCGLIRSNTRYADLFRASVGISAQITGPDWVTRYAARSSRPVPREDMIRAQDGPVILESGLRLHTLPVNGGHAVWTEDVSRLLELRAALEARQEELTERSALLQLEYDREREHKIVEEQNRLYDLLQSRTQGQIDRIERLSRDYGRARSDGERRGILARIVVLGSYIKRRKDLILSLDSAPSLPESKLENALGESFRALGLLGIRGAALVRTGRAYLPGEALTLAYDFFEDAAESVLGTARYLSFRVTAVSGSLRAALLTDADCPLQALRGKYPGLAAVREEDGGTELLLPLEGGDPA